MAALSACGGGEAGVDQVLQFVVHAGAVGESAEEGQRLGDVGADEQVDACGVEGADGGQDILEPALGVVVEAGAQGLVPFRRGCGDPGVVGEVDAGDAHHRGVQHHAGDDEGASLLDRRR